MFANIENQFDKFTDYKKLLFWHFVRQREGVVKREPLAKEYFEQLTNVVLLRALCCMANIDNTPNRNGCWIAASNILRQRDGRPCFTLTSKR